MPEVYLGWEEVAAPPPRLALRLNLNRFFLMQISSFHFGILHLPFLFITPLLTFILQTSFPLQPPFTHFNYLLTKPQPQATYPA